MILPGTKISAEEGKEKETLKSFFMSGGLVLSQVSALTGAAPYDIQNWVRRSFCPSPEKKRYDITRFCRIATICMLKDVLSMHEITGLLSYINGALNDDSDNMIGDDELYFCILCALRSLGSMMPDRQKIIIAIDTASTEFLYHHENVTERLHNVLETVIYAYTSSYYRSKATVCLEKIGVDSDKEE